MTQQQIHPCDRCPESAESGCVRAASVPCRIGFKRTVRPVQGCGTDPRDPGTVDLFTGEARPAQRSLTF